MNGRQWKCIGKPRKEEMHLWGVGRPLLVGSRRPDKSAVSDPLDEPARRWKEQWRVRERRWNGSEGQ